MQTVLNVPGVGPNVGRARKVELDLRCEKVVVLLVDGFSVMQMGKVAEVFELANQLDRANSNFEEHYELRLVSASGGAARSSSGVRIWTDPVSSVEPGSVHALFVLAGLDAEGQSDGRLIEWLKCTHYRARVVKGGGGGGQLLAQADLKPKDATGSKLTMSAMLAQPGEEVGNGGLAGNESDGVFLTALSMVYRDIGYQTAQEIAEYLMPGANRKLASLVFGPREARASEPVCAAVHYLCTNSATRISIADAAHASAMSERNFLRRFKQEMGVTPTEFVLRVRLEKACCMLVETDLPADKVARRTGLGSGDRLAKLFRQHLSMSPTEYRAAARNRTVSTSDGGAAVALLDWLNGSVS